LVSASNLFNGGFTETTIATDAVGTPRPQGAAYDIGPWELVVTATISGGFIAGFRPHFTRSSFSAGGGGLSG
jgi:hypothetical protein